jgi:CubicO group peptidase (beta-lactamase class C family)
MHRSISYALLGSLPIALAGCGSLDRAAGVASGFVSHQLCSAAFVSGLEPERYYREAIAPTLAPVGFLARHSVDPGHREVDASFAGLASARALYRGPLGCLVTDDPTADAASAAPSALPATPHTPALLPEIAGPQPVEPQDPVLKAALDRTFRENAAPPYRTTKAVIVVRDGRVIAERYAPGYGIDTPLLGWSVTKSVTNALLGILVSHGRLDMQAPMPIAAWADPKDPRHAITPDNLLRMNSGLDIGQSMMASASAAFDPTAYMVFGGERDMAGFAEKAPIKASPGSRWNYTNGNTLLLSRLIRDYVGGTPAAVMAFAHRVLFDKLGMQHVTLEFDQTGTPIGSSHMYASARDWAKFGLLFLNDGVVGGERLLPEGWVDYSATQTPGSGQYGYGAGFWTNRGGGEGADYRIAHGIPADAFMARGSGGQYIVIVPSQRLVVARFGPAFTPRDDMDVVAQLVADAIRVQSH